MREPTNPYAPSHQVRCYYTWVLNSLFSSQSSKADEMESRGTDYMKPLETPAQMKNLSGKREDDHMNLAEDPVIYLQGGTDQQAPEVLRKKKGSG